MIKWWAMASVVLGAMLFQACSSESAPKPAAETTKKSPREEAFAKLDPADRELAEAQGYCAVSEAELGSMGMPIKLVINDQPVFLCCKGCEAEAKSEPEKTLATAEASRKKVAEAKAAK